ncbi:MAG: glycosyl transferase family 1 [Marivirga sp.]|nr:glycosyl transferase family 1 [Marivirga sp.]
MKILRVIGSMDPALGGPCQGIRNTIPALEKLGVHNEVVSLDDPSSPFLNQDPFKTHALGPPSSPWQYGDKLIPWLIDNLTRFDVVIIEGLWLYYSHATAKAIRYLRKNSKTVPNLFVMPHGMLDPYFQKAPERRLKAIRNWIYWKLIESHVINSADGVLFTCEAELLLAREPFRPYHPKRELNIGFGIERPPAFESKMHQAFLKQCPELKDQKYFLFLSRIHEKKGVDLLVKAYARVYKEGYPKLVIAGPGLDSAYGRKISQLIYENDEIKGAVSTPGMLAGDSKWGAFYGCEAFVLPSHQENFGIAVVEALACAKPVLISNQVNIWHEIQSEGAGLIGDNTLDGTCRLFENWNSLSSDEKVEMGSKAVDSFEKLFAIGPAAARMVETFQK